MNAEGRLATCHQCGYDRSGDRSPVCPECGAPNEARRWPPHVGALQVAGWVNAVAWLIGYSYLVIETYTYGVEVHYDPRTTDRPWRIGIGLVTAACCAGAFLLARRSERLARLPEGKCHWVAMLLWVVAVTIVLSILVVLGAGEARA
jgi:hypothetical protein